MIYVMRHGESIVNVQRRLTCRLYDGDLSPLGREQAAKAAGIITLEPEPMTGQYICWSWNLVEHLP